MRGGNKASEHLKETESEAAMEWDGREGGREAVRHSRTHYCPRPPAPAHVRAPAAIATATRKLPLFVA